MKALSDASLATIDAMLSEGYTLDLRITAWPGNPSGGDVESAYVVFDRPEWAHIDEMEKADKLAGYTGDIGSYDVDECVRLAAENARHTVAWSVGAEGFKVTPAVAMTDTD